MKHLTFAFVVASSLGAWATPQAAAQSPLADMNKALTQYNNAWTDAQNAANIAGGQNQVNASDAMTQLDTAILAINKAITDFDNGDYTGCYNQLAKAIHYSSLAQEDLALITKGNATVVADAASGGTAATSGDNSAAKAMALIE